jgi:hypothetical protein
MKYTQPAGKPENSPYVDFNPVTGVEGSVVPAAAIENVQREVVNVIVQAGVTPIEANLTQLHQAIVAIVNSMVGSGPVELYSGGGTRENDLGVNATFTVPQYKVGANQLSVYWNGLRCVKDQQYQEVGNAGANSTTIKLLFKLMKSASLFIRK